MHVSNHKFKNVKGTQLGNFASNSCTPKDLFHNLNTILRSYAVFKACMRTQDEALVDGRLSKGGGCRFHDTVVSRVPREIGLMFVEFSS